MAKQRIRQLLFPLGGINRSFAYQNQRPFTCVDALNVRGYGVDEERLRGGRRPGLTKAHSTQLGGGNPVRLLNSVRLAPSASVRYFNWHEGFTGATKRSEWTTLTVGGQAQAAPTLELIEEPARDGAASVTNGTAGLYREFTQVQNTTDKYTVQLSITSGVGGTAYWPDGAVTRYRIYALMTDGAADAEVDGIVVEIVLTVSTGQAYNVSGTLKTYKSSVETKSYTLNQSNNQHGFYWVQLHIDRTAKTASVEVPGATLGDALDIDGTNPNDYLDWAGGLGNAVGFAIQGDGVGIKASITRFYLQWHSASAVVGQERDMLIASANGLVYNSYAAESITQSNTAATLASDVPLYAVERLGKLYIADYSATPIAAASDGATTSLTVFDSASYADWTALSLNLDGAGDSLDYGLAIHSGNSAGFYLIEDVVADNFDTNPAHSTATDDNTGMSQRFTIERAVKVYNPEFDALTLLTATAGQVPVGCRLIALYRDRIVLARPQEDKHLFYMSRSGTPTDWDYGSDVTDTERAISAAVGVAAGRIGDPISALIVHSDDYMIIGCEHSLYRIVGDLAFGGNVMNLSRKIGPLSQGAWCHTPTNDVIFLSEDGLYQLAAGGSSYPTPMSRDKLPLALQIDKPEEYEYHMMYSVRERGVHIFVVPSSGVQGIHWWYDIQMDAFWQTILDANHQPGAIFDYSGDSITTDGVILGCRDGYIRQFSYGNFDDDGTAISSYAYLGPILLGQSDYSDGVLMEMSAVLDDNSGDVDWELYVGEDAEDAYRKTTAFASGTWSAGTNYTVHPRAGGHAAYLKLLGASGAGAWAVETVRVRSVSSIGQRKL